MSGKAAKILLTEKQQDILQSISRSTTAPSRLIQRVSAILMAFAGLFNATIADEIGLRRKQVGLWRRRWQQSFDALVAIECQESQAALRRAIEDVLSDAPRSGSPGTFTAEQVTQILAVACESPELSGRPIDRWTHRELADEVILREIVTTISISQVGRYLAQAELQPHRSKYWLTTKEKDPEVFAQQVQTVCQTYLEAPDLESQENTHTVSVDEMPGIQALERIAKTIPMQSGQVERIEFEYKRHGTLCLIGNWDVVQGQMIAPTIRLTRTEEDFMWHIYHTVQTDAQALIGFELYFGEENIGYVHFGANSMLESIHNLMRESLSSPDNGNLLLDREIRHDLRNRVAVVKGFSDLMRMEAPDDHPSARVLDQIIGRSREFVDLLDGAKFEADCPEDAELLAMAS